MAITAASSNLVATMLEQVNPKLSYFLVKNQSKFAKLFQKSSEKHRVSAWNAGGVVSAWRIPVLQSMGGDYQAVSLDGGDLGTGSVMKTAYMTLGYFSNDTAYNIPSLAMMATKTNQQAITNALQHSIGNAIKETALYNEIGLFQDGTGILATATTVVSGNGNSGTSVVYNLETSDFTYIRLRGQNMLVDVADTGNVLRSLAARITNINFSGNQVTILSANNYTPATGDKLVFPGMGPVTSTTLSSGSWRYGLYSFNTTNTTGSLLGLSYSSVYELACPSVNAAGGFFTPSLLLAGKSQLIQRRDDEAFAGILGVCHMAQRASWYLEGVTISNWFRGKSDQMIDIVPSGTGYGDTFVAGDVTHHVSRYADKSRVDWFSPKNFGWVNLQEMSFFTTPEGQRTFIGRSATTGNPQAGVQFYCLNTDNLYTVDPGTSVVYSQLAIPSGQ
jgi:hypothetical protein